MSPTNPCGILESRTVLIYEHQLKQQISSCRHPCMFWNARSPWTHSITFPASALNSQFAYKHIKRENMNSSACLISVFVVLSDRSRSFQIYRTFSVTGGSHNGSAICCSQHGRLEHRGSGSRWQHNGGLHRRPRRAAGPFVPIFSFDSALRCGRDGVHLQHGRLGSEFPRRHWAVLREHALARSPPGWPRSPCFPWSMTSCSDVAKIVTWWQGVWLSSSRFQI